MQEKEDDITLVVIVDWRCKSHFYNSSYNTKVSFFVYKAAYVSQRDIDNCYIRKENRPVLFPAVPIFEASVERLLILMVIIFYCSSIVRLSCLDIFLYLFDNNDNCWEKDRLGSGMYQYSLHSNLHIRHFAFWTQLWLLIWILRKDMKLCKPQL